MRRVEHIMGMPVSIDIPDASKESIFRQVFDRLTVIDATYSPYKKDSDVSLYRQNKQRFSLSPEFREIMKACDYYEKDTNGYFSPYYNKNEGFDPSGYVKAWAITQCQTLIEKEGYPSYLINIAGDIVGAGTQKTWRIGIQDPFNLDQIKGVVSLHESALATSGTYQRGTHIFDPHTSLASSDICSVSVLGPSIIKADVYATAMIAMGIERASVFIKGRPHYAAYMVTQDNKEYFYNGFLFDTGSD